TGERPVEADRLITPILEELAMHHFDAGNGIARRFEAEVSRPAVTAAGLPKDFDAVVEKGYKDVLQGLPEGQKTIIDAVEAAHANPGAFALDQNKKTALQKALIALALAHKQAGDQTAMKDALRELARSFPDAQVPRSVYGPD